MEFTNRQLIIISYILNHPDGIKGSEAASHVGISVRTLQMEIKAINEILPAEEQIVSYGRKGYFTKGFTEQTRQNILQQISDRHTMKMPQDRVNDIMTFLMFQKDYVSMEKLAEQFFVSKATIFKEFENSRMLQDFVEISKVKGLRVPWEESVKRYKLAKTFDKDSAWLYEPDLKKEYEWLNSAFRKILPDMFAEHHYFVSGESMRVFRRHLIITLIRNKRGFLMEHISEEIEISSLMRELAVRIESLTGLKLSKEDMQDCQIKLNELNSFYKDIPSYRARNLTDYEAGLARLEEALKEKFGLDWRLTGEEKGRFLLHVMKLDRRVRRGHYISNYLKREVQRKYPMSTHLILELFWDCFQIRVPETEVTYLALYLAGRLEENTSRIDCAMISEMHPGVLYHTVNMLRKHYEDALGEILILEDYLYKSRLTGYREKLILTTKESITLRLPEAILIKPVLQATDYQSIDRKLEELVTRQKEQRMNEALVRYLSHAPVVLNGTYGSMSRLLDSIGEAWPEGSYEFVLDVNAMLYPRIHYGDQPNRIKVYFLEHPVLHRGMEIRIVIFSDYYNATMQMQPFYECLQSLLDPEQIRKMVRNYLQ